MAYNSYFPVTYQPTYYPYQQQTFQQPQQQFQQQQQVTSSGIIWVGSEMEAQNYPVAPNNAVALWDSSKPAIYLKQADASGRPVIKVYSLVEQKEAPKTPVENPEYKLSDYALKSDIEPLMGAITALKEEVKALKRKKEVTSDDE